MRSLAPVLAAALVLATPCAVAAEGLSVIHSDSRVLELEWTSTGLDLVSDGSSLRPVVAGGLSLAEPGEPDLPTIAKLVGVPWHGTARLQIVSVATEAVPWPDVARVPDPPFGSDRRAELPEPRNGGELFPDAWATLSATFSVRGQRMTRLLLHPCRYDASRGELLRAASLRLRIEFDGAWGSAGRETDAPAWEAALDTTLLNPEVARNWRASRVRVRGGADSFESAPHWIRVPLEEAGVYGIDSFTFANLGFDPATIDPTSVRVFSGPNLPLPDEYASPPPAFMTECALLELGNHDPVFDVEDGFLFYGLGPHGWASEYDSTLLRAEHVENPYTDASCYWITWGGAFSSPPKRMSMRTVAPSGVSYATSAPHRVHFEENRVPDFRYPGEDGWFWEDLSFVGQDRAYVLPLDRVASGDGTLVARLASWGDFGSSRRVELKVAGVVVADSTWTHSPVSALVDVESEPFQGLLHEGPNTIVVNVDTSAPGSDDGLYTAWFEVEYDRALTAANGFLKLASASGVFDYELGGFDAAEVLLFDVSDPHQVVRLTDFELGTPSPLRSVRFSDAAAAQERWYVAASTDGVMALPAPEIAEIARLRRPSPAAEYLVIYHPSLRDGAERLANLRGGPGLPSARAVSLADIYDEFSWGLRDPVAIRDFLAYTLYNWSTAPLFVALLGDACYDPKGHHPGSPEDQVPAYENRYRTETSADYVPDTNLNFYPTDDFYGYLEPEDYEGAAVPALDVAIGRFPSPTPKELDVLLDKLESYLAGETPGPWQNRVVLSADDERVLSGIDFIRHTEQVEELAREWFPQALDKAKVYLTEFPMDEFGRKPEAQEKFIEEFNRGALFVSYTGHGDINTLAQEQVFVKAKTSELTNGTRLPIFTTFSCTVSRFDLLSGDCMTERLLHHPSGGAVATFSSGGLVFPSESFQLHKAWLGELFGPWRNVRPIGIGAWIAKVLTGATRNRLRNNEKYLLLGDPALEPRFARYDAEFDEVTVTTDSIERSRRVIRASLVDQDGAVLDDYHGTAFVRVTDNADTSGYTYEHPGGFVDHFDYALEGETLYEGEVPVTGGRLEARFLIPEAVTPGDLGRVSVFAVEDGEARVASGAFDSLHVAPTIGSAPVPKPRE